MKIDIYYAPHIFLKPCKTLVKQYRCFHKIFNSANFFVKFSATILLLFVNSWLITNICSFSRAENSTRRAKEAKSLQDSQKGVIGQAKEVIIRAEEALGPAEEAIEGAQEDRGRKRL
jgi:hypothetical protein